MSTETKTPPPDDTAVDLRKATLQEIAAFSAKVLERANPRAMVRTVWVAKRKRLAQFMDRDERAAEANALIIQLSATAAECTGCAVGTILLHDGPEALRDWVIGPAGGAVCYVTDGWKAGNQARIFLMSLSNAFEHANTREAGLERCIAIARYVAAGNPLPPRNEFGHDMFVTSDMARAFFRDSGTWARQ